MKRCFVIPSVVSFASLIAFASLGCDLTQELQGAGADGGGGPVPPAAIADAAPPAVLPTPDGGGGVDASAKGPVSICIPNVSAGSVKLLVDGSENAYMNDVSDITFTPSRVFALSAPFSFLGAPYGGGPVDSYSMTATIPSFIAFAIGPANASAGGSRTNQNLGGTELPANGGRIFGLKGGSGSMPSRPGEVLLDGNDLVFWTRSPAQLVQASLSGGAERVIADYPDASNTTVTALALDATDIWFTTIVGGGGAGPGTGGALHRVPRAGGAVVDVASLPVVAGGILFDGNLIYLGSSINGGGDLMMVFDKVSGTVTYRGLMSKNLGSSRIELDGTFFYWAESNGADTCNGTFKRRNKNGSPEETLLTNLDRVVQLRMHNGAFYLGTTAHVFRKPATRGQLFEWKP